MQDLNAIVSILKSIETSLSHPLVPYIKTVFFTYILFRAVCMLLGLSYVETLKTIRGYLNKELNHLLVNPYPIREPKWMKFTTLYGSACFSVVFIAGYVFFAGSAVLLFSYSVPLAIYLLVFSVLFGIFGRICAVTASRSKHELQAERIQA